MFDCLRSEIRMGVQQADERTRISFHDLYEFAVNHVPLFLNRGRETLASRKPGKSEEHVESAGEAIVGTRSPSIELSGR